MLCRLRNFRGNDGHGYVTTSKRDYIALTFDMTDYATMKIIYFLCCENLVYNVHWLSIIFFTRGREDIGCNKHPDRIKHRTLEYRLCHYNYGLAYPLSVRLWADAMQSFFGTDLEILNYKFFPESKLGCVPIANTTLYCSPVSCFKALILTVLTVSNIYLIETRYSHCSYCHYGCFKAEHFTA